MRGQEAEVMLLAIGLQESKFLFRKQVGGPAKGFYQFEHNGGYKGVLSHPLSRDLAMKTLDYLSISTIDGFDALAFNDTLSTVFARLLLYTDPHRLPEITDDVSVSWATYLRIWRPGRPHYETWSSCVCLAKDEVKK